MNNKKIGYSQIFVTNPPEFQTFRNAQNKKEAIQGHSGVLGGGQQRARTQAVITPLTGCSLKQGAPLFRGESCAYIHAVCVGRRLADKKKIKKYTE